MPDGPRRCWGDPATGRDGGTRLEPNLPNRITLAPGLLLACPWRIWMKCPKRATVFVGTYGLCSPAGAYRTRQSAISPSASKKKTQRTHPVGALLDTIADHTGPLLGRGSHVYITLRSAESRLAGTGWFILVVTRDLG